MIGRRRVAARYNDLGLLLHAQDAKSERIARAEVSLRVSSKRLLYRAPKCLLTTRNGPLASRNTVGIEGPWALTRT